MKPITVQIDKGAPHGEKYVFHGSGNEHPNMEAGDVVVVLQEEPHKQFKRKGADLIMEKEITLLEALTGVSFAVDFLDGTKLKVSS